MADLASVVSYLDDYLCVRDVRDAPEALNGLQVANSGRATSVAAAVDLCHATIRMAVDRGADLMLVHHGLFWGGLRPLTGPHYRRVAELVRHDIAVYGAHLPLDCHPTVGNAAVLAQLLSVEPRGAMADRHGQAVGLWGECDATREAFSRQLALALGGPAHPMEFGPERVRKVGIVTGGAGSMIASAAALGLDTFVTGEGAHYHHFDAEELGLNVYFGGHYGTETFGVRALAEHVGAKFSLPWLFLDHPTGL